MSNTACYIWSRVPTGPHLPVPHIGSARPRPVLGTGSNWPKLAPPAGSPALPTSWGVRDPGPRVPAGPHLPVPKTGSPRAGLVFGSWSDWHKLAPRGRPGTPHGVECAGTGPAWSCRPGSLSSKHRVDEGVARFGGSVIPAQTGPPRAPRHSPRRGERGEGPAGALTVRISQFQNSGRPGCDPFWQLGHPGPNRPPAGALTLPTPRGARGKGPRGPADPDL